MEALTGRNSPVTGETGRRVFNNVPSRESWRTLNASRVCKHPQRGVVRQTPPFPMPTAVKARAGGFRAPLHMAIALNTPCKRSGKPCKAID